MNQQTFSFNRHYFIIAAFIFVIEVCIALFIRDKFVRPYLGDFLVVILIYCFLKSFWAGTPLVVGLTVLIFSFAVEIGQHFQLVKLLKLNHSELATVVIGTGFDWLDLLAYTLGIAVVLGIERWVMRNPLTGRQRRAN